MPFEWRFNCGELIAYRGRSHELRGLLTVFGIRLPSWVGHGPLGTELRETCPMYGQRGEEFGTYRSNLPPLP